MNGVLVCVIGGVVDDCVRLFLYVVIGRVVVDDVVVVAKLKGTRTGAAGGGTAGGDERKESNNVIEMNNICNCFCCRNISLSDITTFCILVFHFSCLFSFYYH